MKAEYWTGTQSSQFSISSGIDEAEPNVSCGWNFHIAKTLQFCHDLESFIEDGGSQEGFAITHRQYDEKVLPGE